jgi:translocation and assembly module TamB
MSTVATVGGRFGAPEYTGRIKGSEIGLRNLLLGVDLRGGDVDISLKGDTAQIERLRLQGGDGELTVTGGAEFGETPRARLQLQASRFRAIGRIDRQLTVSGQAALELRADLLRLDGKINVDEGLYDVSRRDAPSLDDDVVVRTEADTLPAAGVADATRAPRRQTQVTLDIDLGNKLRVRGHGLDTLLAGQLRITTPGGRLAVNGTVSAVDGTYAAYGQKLEIDRGVLVFSGPPENPVLNILALRPNLDARVGVAIGGTFISPRVRLYAEPDMGDPDKLSWLVLGRPSEGLGRADTALLQRAAVALLAGEREAPTDALMRQIGLDELSLRQSEGDVRDTVITLGKQLSRRWYVGYERSANAATGTWQLIYRIAQRFTLRAQSGNDNSLDLIWIWRVDEPGLWPMPKSPRNPP